jgi:hypothetical protein
MRRPDPVIKVEEIWISKSQARIFQAGQPLGWHRPDLIIYDDEKRLRAVEVFEKELSAGTKNFSLGVF